jgi:hypothetical protein
MRLRSDDIGPGKGAAMKRSPFVALAMMVGIVATAVSTSACSTTTAGAPATATSRSAPATTSVAPQIDSVCGDMNGTVGPDRICHVHSVTPTYKLDMTFPLNYPDMRAVTDFLKQDRDNFVGWVTTFGPRDGRRRPYQYVVTAKAYHSGKPDAGTQSLALEIDNDTGYANEGHPDTTYRAFNFDSANRAAITFDTLFKPGTKPLEVLNPIVKGDLDAPSADLDETTYRNFALTDDAVIFFFGQNQVVPDNNGRHRVTVARIELASLLA